ncbi:MAG: tryptophan synthase subunit alpha [Phycisphaerales bacterium]
MGRIDDIFSNLRAENRKALMPFLCAGYPTMERSHAAILACVGAGASVIEIGIPFSDPIADGPVIAGAMHEAPGQGVAIRRIRHGAFMEERDQCWADRDGVVLDRVPDGRWWRAGVHRRGVRGGV